MFKRSNTLVTLMFGCASIKALMKFASFFVLYIDPMHLGLQPVANQMSSATEKRQQGNTSEKPLRNSTVKR